jgi:hypothetical protein
MSACRWIVLALMTGLAGCATRQESNPEFSAKNRPLEERCVRAHSSRSASKPGLTQAEVQAEARAAAQRGELDKACDWL